MNKIELTTEQIGKLFSMLKNFYKDDLVDTFVDGNILFKVHHEDDNELFIKMHWMEVCLTHLASKIIFKSGKPLHYCKDTYFRLTDNVMKTFFDEDKQVHPVDFLYKEFEKNFTDDRR